MSSSTKTLENLKILKNIHKKIPIRTSNIFQSWLSRKIYVIQKMQVNEQKT